MIRLKNLRKNYQTAAGVVKALDSIDLEIKKGEFIVLRGPSGSGKTTLLMALAGMQRPTSGSIYISKENIYQMTIPARAKFRAENIGFVFQMFHLVPYLNVIENVALARGALSSALDKPGAKELLRSFGMEHRIFHKPAQLSAGEKQRTAIARALFNHPQIILADEPTGNLDPENALAVLGYLTDFQSAGGTVIIATHQPVAKEMADRIISLNAGRIRDES
ncbi:MAG: ABC transporter ATP-binding protein [Planctomycetes bacterium]|nr:ABC transporter ATP-binding protein [Planctomycetota bacterium]